MILRSFRPFTAALTILLVLPAVAHGGKPVAPGQYKGWNDLDKVEIFQTFKLSDYRSVVVLPVETRGVELPDKGDNTARAVEQVAGTITGTFTEGLAEGAPKGVSVIQMMGGGTGSLVIKARVVKINPGSEAARSLLGLAGKIMSAARVAIAGDVIDGRTKKVLFHFEQQRSSGMNGHRHGVELAGFQLGGDNPYVTLLNRSAGEIGEDLGNALKAFN